MSAVLSREQADLLAAYGTWQVSWMLTDPDTGISHVKGMASGALTASWSWETTSKGIAACRGRHPRVDPRNDPDILVTWAQIRAASKALPEHLLAELAAARSRTQREYRRKFPEFRAVAPGGRDAWCAPPPEWHRAAQDDERATVRAALDVLCGAGPHIRTHIGPFPPGRPKDPQTYLWSRCWTCGWYVDHLEERSAMEHTIATSEHRCDTAEAEQLDLFEALS